MIRTWRIAFLAAAIVSAGCTTPPVQPTVADTEGIITLDGEPLKRVEVLFVLENNTALVARGVSDDEGRFKLTCNGQPGAYEGENLVMVKETEVPDEIKRQRNRDKIAEYRNSLGGRPLPARYTSLADNPPKVTVKAEQKMYFIHLTN